MRTYNNRLNLCHILDNIQFFCTFLVEVLLKHRRIKNVSKFLVWALALYHPTDPHLASLRQTELRSDRTNSKSRRVKKQMYGTSS